MKIDIGKTTMMAGKVIAVFLVLTLVGVYVLGAFGAVAGTCYSNDDCSAGYFCELPRYTCTPPGTCESIPEECEAIDRPVCGCDNNIYDNICETRTAGISQADDDDTDDIIICCNPNNATPKVCGADGNVYWKNFCGFGDGKELYLGAYRTFSLVLIEECPSGCSGGVCADACIPDCTGKVCGDDSCGGSCGVCIATMRCEAGQCVPLEECGVVGETYATQTHICPDGRVVDNCVRTCQSDKTWGDEVCEDVDVLCAGGVWDRVVGYLNTSFMGVPYWAINFIASLGIVGVWERGFRIK